MEPRSSTTPFPEQTGELFAKLAAVELYEGNKLGGGHET